MKDKAKRRLRRSLSLLVALGLISSYVFYALQAPVQAIQPRIASYELQLQTPEPSFTWPTATQAAVSLSTADSIQTRGAQKPRPTASTAKVVTALAILDKKPLARGKQGPTITITTRDVQRFNDYVAQEGSVMPVRVGQQLTQYQALQAILLPSANNVADTLAIWAFGSLKNYQDYANRYVRTELGLKDTRIGTDASGLSPTSVSTAHDLVAIGKAAMRHPVIAEIVAQPSAANIPDVGTIYNVNGLLGSNGIIGIKTGNSNEAGGVFLGAATTGAEGETVTVITAVMGTPTRSEALNQTVPLLESARNNLKPVRVINRGAVVGSYHQPWSDTAIPATAASDVVVTAWKGSTVPANVSLKPIEVSARHGEQVGTVRLAGDQSAADRGIPVMLASSPTTPPWWWKLLHPPIPDF